jgi:hypothetical protein
MNCEVGVLLGLFAEGDEGQPQQAAASSSDWTPAEDITILEGLDRGDTRAELAHQLGRPVESVSERISLLRLEGRYTVPERHGARWTDEEDTFVRSMARQGAPYKDIGRRVCRTAGAIRMRLAPYA